jgi:hypothetical protein
MDGIEMYDGYIFILFSGCYDQEAIGYALNLSLPNCLECSEGLPAVGEPAGEAVFLPVGGERVSFSLTI